MRFESCLGCRYWISPECKRYPPTKDGYPIASRGCGEYKEITYYAIEEREVEESRVTEHQRIDALGSASETSDSDSDGQGREGEKEKEIRKRGWPKGKPRK